MKDAQYTVKFWPNYTKTGNPTATWVLKTDENARVKYDADHLVSGDELHKRADGNAYELHLGTITIQETQAPEGYNLNNTTYTLYIIQKTSGGDADIYWDAAGNNPVSIVGTGNDAALDIQNDETPKYGSITVNKSTNVNGYSLAGFKFRITGTSDSGAQTVNEVITTNALGQARLGVPANQTGFHLEYGTYTITEELTEEQQKIFKGLSASTVTVSETTPNVSYNVTNESKVDTITINKSTDINGYPVSGFKFRITGTSDYGTVVNEVITTNAQGQASLGVAANQTGFHLEYGTYTITEELTEEQEKIWKGKSAGTVTVNDTTKNVTYNLTNESKVLCGIFGVYKTDADNNNSPVSGLKFDVWTGTEWATATSAGQITTGTDGVAVFGVGNFKNGRTHLLRFVWDCQVAINMCKGIEKRMKSLFEPTGLPKHENMEAGNTCEHDSWSIFKMLKRSAMPAMLCVALFIGGCSEKDGVKETQETKSHATKKASETEMITENETEDERDYYVDGGCLYINRIYYATEYVLGKNQYVYDTPWTSKDTPAFDKLVVNAKLVCKRDNGKDGAQCVNLSAGIFTGMNNIKDAKVSLDMGDVRDVSFLLAECDDLVSADVTLSGSHIESAAYMFTEDKKLNHVNVYFSADPPEYVQRMFYGCSALMSADVRISGTVKNCTEMYYGCTSLKGAQVSFDIGEDTLYNMMFGGCESLSGVEFAGVRVDKGGSALFDNINSIGSYTFANSFSVKEGQLADPIGDSIYTSVVIPLGKGDAMLEVIYYSKARPEWYKNYIVDLHDLHDWYEISTSPARDIYINFPSGINGDITADDVLSAIDDAFAKLIEEKYGDDVKELLELKEADDFVEGVENLYK